MARYKAGDLGARLITERAVRQHDRLIEEVQAVWRCRAYAGA
ncbi:hypothetical protein [Nonomuraea rubra]|uniref:Uncharacterized protein n=1 Tax=Nonomuraea rubra TaxID=46180 RepID=A0A7X0NTZ9_9ACTN|nr:hypothetical protein [Nonomuraea rubra]MBB6549550.1 hypothetical protein [Nonomuraea rubra]